MTKYQLAFSLVLLTDEPNKTLHFYLCLKKNGRNQPKLWQNDSWFEEYLTVICEYLPTEKAPLLKQMT